MRQIPVKCSRFCTEIPRVNAGGLLPERRPFAGRTSWVVGASVLTAAAFVALHRAGVLGDVPLPVLLAPPRRLVRRRVRSRCGDGVPSRRAGSCTRSSPSRSVASPRSSMRSDGARRSRSDTRSSSPVISRRSVRASGSRRSDGRSSGIACGQAAIALGWVSSYVGTPAVQGLGALSALGVGFIVHLLGTKTAAWEQANGELPRASEANVRQLFSKNPQPMWVYDTETLAFVEVNAAAIEHYGYTRDEFLAMCITDIRPADELPRLMDELELRTPRAADGRDVAAPLEGRSPRSTSRCTRTSSCSRGGPRCWSRSRT